MILPINIDLQEVIEEFSLNENQSFFLGSTIIDRIVEEYTLRWEELVDRNLHQSRGEYKRAMFIDRSSPLDVTFGLSERESKLALMVEEGASAFDEKIGFEKSNKTKVKKNGGWYLTIPFRHATPNAVAESGIFNSILPKDVYNIAAQNTKPLKRTQLPDNQQLPGRRKEINLPGLVVPEYIHKTAKYEGLVKVNIASTDREKRSGYFTFRRVSDVSDPNSWWNGGLVPQKLMNKALEVAQIDKVADIAIDKFLQNI